MALDTVNTRVLGLRCRECQAEYTLRATHVCEACFGPLDVLYDYDAIRRVVSRERIEAGPPTMWRGPGPLPRGGPPPPPSPGAGLSPPVAAGPPGRGAGLPGPCPHNDSH